MSTIILPSMTNQMILDCFKILVKADLSKSQDGAWDFNSGCQEGMIITLAIVFGEAADNVAENMYDQGNSWIHVVAKIVEQKLSYWVNYLKNNCPVIDDYKKMQEDIDKAVEEYALENPKHLIDALKHNL